MADANGGARDDAAAAGLRYVEDGEPGFTRRRRGKGFSYLDQVGRPLTDAAERERVRSLAVAPAWSDVWVCPYADGHLQATGRDEAGRKQYVYHPAFTAVRDAAKFARLGGFGALLPRVRRRVRRDLRRDGLDRVRLVAAAVRLMDLSLLRVGNASYARSNGSYGATTLRDKHVRVDGDAIDLRFVGKSGERHVHTLVDDELAAVIRDCQELPGYELFRYRGEGGAVQSIDSGDVNDYLRDVSGEDVSAKDFRTWGGTVVTAGALYRAAAGAGGEPRSQAARKRLLKEAVCSAAEALGNTPAVCRQSYVHPAVFAAFDAGEFTGAYAEAVRRARERRPRELRLHEAATLAFLDR
ncbi:MAG TPA: hypothetical protein VFF08_01235 [Trueperaceae bacterium]|nr:hypothetical protein [Trueperaceae bacterium]